MSPLAVNAWGDLRSRSPQAESARLTVLALLAAGVEVEVVETELDRLMPDAHVLPAIDVLRRVSPADRTAVVDVHLDDLDGFARKPRSLVHPRGRRAYAIGTWTYDRPHLTWDTVFPLDAVDEVWVGSTHTQDVFLRGTTTPVHVVPPVVTASGAAPDRARLGLQPTSFVLGCAFDARGSYEVAGLHALVKAYARAFAPHERGTSTTLALGVRGLESRPSLSVELARLATSVRARLVELDDDDAFLASCDAYVSLHRRESTGRKIARAMAAGVPVIATAWGAHLDWADLTSTRHVGYAVTAVEAHHHRFDQRLRKVHAVGETWAEPDVEQAAFWMRDLRDRPAERVRLGALGRAAVEQRLSPTAVGAVIRERLASLADRLAVLPPGA